MASTVTGNQGSDKRSTGFGWLRRRDVRADQPRTTPRHSTFPQPDAPTQILPPVPARATAPLHRDESTNPDPAALYMASLCIRAVREHWSSTHLRAELATPLRDLDGWSAKEREGGATIARRVAAAEQTAERVAAAIEAAVLVHEVTGKPVDLDTTVLGNGLAALSVNARTLTEETMHGLPMPPLTDPRLPLHAPEVTQVLPSPQQFPPFGQDNGHAHPEVAEQPSPVHAPTESAPVPDAEPTGLIPLPQRRPVHWISVADHPQVHGKLVNPAETEIVAGDWVQDEGSDCSGGPAWGLVRDIAVGEFFTLIEFASKLTVEIKAGRLVKVLTSSEAKALLEQDAQVAS
jgi:hypothetical protein